MRLEYIKLSKGMSQIQVNDLIYDFMKLDDKYYSGNNNPHNWKCKCGNIIKSRRWSDISKRRSFYCSECVRDNKYKHAVEKDEEYEYIKSYAVGEKLSNGSIAKTPHLRIKHRYCGNIYEVQSGQFLNMKKGCSVCCGSYENSFAYHIEIELGLKLEDVWDFEKNTLNPRHIWKGSGKKVWIKCQGREINNLNKKRMMDYHKSSLVYCNNFIKGNKCKYCVSVAIHPYDSFGYHNFDKVMSWHPENDISPFKVSCSSSKSFKFICEECGNEWSSILANVSKGKWCPQCSKSKGEKKIKLWLDCNNANYINDEPYFKDLLSDYNNPLRPDFILPEHKIWIEYDGEFHYKDIYNDGSYELAVEYDKRKDEYAEKHGWKMIRIPYWDFDNIEKILENKIII